MSSFDRSPFFSPTLPVPNVRFYVTVAPLRSRVQRSVVPDPTRIPATGCERGDYTNLRMGYHYVCSVPPRCRALRSVLDFCPPCGRDRPGICRRIVVCFTSHSDRRSSFIDLTFDPRVDGVAYTDVLHVYGMSRAGYVPQMWTSSLPSPVVVFELLQKAGARALIYEPSFDVDLSGCPVPAHLATQVSEQDVAGVTLPPLQTDYSASDLVFILHTSGSTGDSPKLVPYSRRLLDNIVTKSRQTAQARLTQSLDVTVAM